VEADEPLRQGELLAGLHEPIVKELAPKEVDVEWQIHPLALLVTQDCDLEQDHAQRRAGVTDNYLLLKRVLLCEVSSAEEARNLQRRPGMPEINSAAWKSVSQNLGHEPDGRVRAARAAGIAARESLAGSAAGTPAGAARTGAQRAPPCGRGYAAAEEPARAVAGGLI